MARSNAQPVIIRRIDEGHAHEAHGGAWKVAYADFMTALMAFFLLLWIVSNATKDQLKGVADYFTPAKVSMTASGGTGALGGTTIGPKGIMNASTGLAEPKAILGTEQVKPHEETHPLPQLTTRDNPAAAVTPNQSEVITPNEAAAQTGASADGKAAKVITVTKVISEHDQDKARFKKVEQEIEHAIQSSPDLRPLQKNVLFEQTPEGLNIQIVDQNKRPMFASGSAHLSGPALELMQRLGRAISGLPNKILIAGHTDAVPYADGAGQDNWELSSERANATRRVFTSSGVSPSRITRISGLADTEPLKPEDPLDPSNRRITVLLAYQPGAKTTGPTIEANGTVTPGKVLPAADQTTPKTGPAPAARTTAAATEPMQQAQAAPDQLDHQYSLISLADLRKGN
ncbi:chemotaxis protein MotB [Thioclava sp. BHET1]|nr:chemotaxis protein MotB [Thioclava sp. BHET1]